MKICTKKYPCLVLLFVVLPLAAEAVTWTGNAGDGNWNTGANWSGNTAPDSSDNVEIPASTPSYPDFSYGTPANPVASLEIKFGASLTFASGAKLTVTGAVTVGGTLNLVSGILDVSGDLASTGTITSSGGSIIVMGNVTQGGGGMNGTVTITAGGSAGIELGYSNKLTSAVLKANGGNIKLKNASGGTLSLAANAAAAGKTITITEDGDIVAGAGGITADSNITLNATVTFEVNSTAVVKSNGGGITFGRNLEIPQSAAVTVDCPGGVLIEGNVELYGTLNAALPASATITITVGGNWTQTQANYADPAHTGTFNPGRGTVIFRNSTVKIDGVNTTWYNLSFTNPGATTVQFRNYPNPQYTSALGHHIHGVFNITTGTNSILTSLTSTGPADAGSLPPGSPVSASEYNLLSATRADKFWNLYYDPNNTGVFDALVDTALDWCWVRPTVYKAMTIPLTGDWVVPYVSNSRYNVGWNVFYLVYSFTEDWDHNGRIDHIRVQSSAPAGLDFTGFLAEVDGYTVKRVFRYTASLSSPPGISDYVFFIELEEKNYPDTDQSPSWKIVDYGNFKTAGGAPFSLLDSARIPIDTAPPQIAYSLALPGGNEIFVRMSEPVEFVTGFSAAASIRVNGTPGTYTLVPVTTVSGRLLEFMITGVDPSVLTAAHIALGLNFEFMRPSQGYFHDSPLPFSYPPVIGAQTAGSYLIWPKGRDYGYGAVPNAYEDRAPAWTGGDPVIPLTGMQNYNWNNVSSSPVYDYVHRISDLLVAQAPTGAAAPFFVQPVYAHDVSGEGGANSRYRVFNFDGTGELLYSDLTIQAKLNDAVAQAPGAGGLELYYAQDTRIPAGFRSTGQGIEGLWLPAPPVVPVPPFQGISGLAPRYYQATHVTGLPQGGNLYNFHIPRSTLPGAGTLEFYFGIRGLVSDLFIARLDTAAGSAGPWYRRIKPFALRIVNLTQQRGGVTIFKNVINPGLGDNVMLSCVLGSGGRVTAQVFSMDGSLIKTLENGERSAGNVVLRWDGKNATGRTVARGLYFIRVVAPDIDEIRKVMVVW
jgi:hypothetical protein